MMPYYDSDQFEDTLASLRAQVEGLRPDGHVPYGVARDIVRASAWWLSHRYGPVRAPKHADNLTEHPSYGWQIEFGANAFLVGHAVSICCQLLTKYLDSIGDEDRQSFSDLRKLLEYAPRWAVANYAGERYETYQLDDGDPSKMVFGTQAIDVKDFADRVLYWVPVQKLEDLLDDW